MATPRPLGGAGPEAPARPKAWGALLAHAVEKRPVPYEAAAECVQALADDEAACRECVVSVCRRLAGGADDGAHEDLDALATSERAWCRAVLWRMMREAVERSGGEDGAVAQGAAKSLSRSWPFVRALDGAGGNGEQVEAFALYHGLTERPAVALLAGSGAKDDTDDVDAGLTVEALAAERAVVAWAAPGTGAPPAVTAAATSIVRRMAYRDTRTRQRMVRGGALGTLLLRLRDDTCADARSANAAAACRLLSDPRVILRCGPTHALLLAPLLAPFTDAAVTAEPHRSTVRVHEAAASQHDDESEDLADDAAGAPLSPQEKLLERSARAFALLSRHWSGLFALIAAPPNKTSVLTTLVGVVRRSRSSELARQVIVALTSIADTLHAMGPAGMPALGTLAQALGAAETTTVLSHAAMTCPSNATRSMLIDCAATLSELTNSCVPAIPRPDEVRNLRLRARSGRSETSVGGSAPSAVADGTESRPSPHCTMSVPAHSERVDLHTYLFSDPLGLQGSGLFYGSEVHAIASTIPAHVVASATSTGEASMPFVTVTTIKQHKWCLDHDAIAREKLEQARRLVLDWRSPADRAAASVCMVATVPESAEVLQAVHGIPLPTGGNAEEALHPPSPLGKSEKGSAAESPGHFSPVGTPKRAYTLTKGTSDFTLDDPNAADKTLMVEAEELRAASLVLDFRSSDFEQWNWGPIAALCRGMYLHRPKVLKSVMRGKFAKRLLAFLVKRLPKLPADSPFALVGTEVGCDLCTNLLATIEGSAIFADGGVSDGSSSGLGNFGAAMKRAMSEKSTASGGGEEGGRVLPTIAGALRAEIQTGVDRSQRIVGRGTPRRASVVLGGGTIRILHPLALAETNAGCLFDLLDACAASRFGRQHIDRLGLAKMLETLVESAPMLDSPAVVLRMLEAINFTRTPNPFRCVVRAATHCRQAEVQYSGIRILHDVAARAACRYADVKDVVSNLGSLGGASEERGGQEWFSRMRRFSDGGFTAGESTVDEMDEGDRGSDGVDSSADCLRWTVGSLYRLVTGDGVSADAKVCAASALESILGMQGECGTIVARAVARANNGEDVMSLLRASLPAPRAESLLLAIASHEDGLDMLGRDWASVAYDAWDDDVTGLAWAYPRQASGIATDGASPDTSSSFAPGIAGLPRHLFGSLAATKAGLLVLWQSGTVKRYMSTLRDDESAKRRAAALWALGHIAGASDTAGNHAFDLGALEALTDAASASDDFSLRGIALQALSLAARAGTTRSFLAGKYAETVGLWRMRLWGAPWPGWYVLCLPANAARLTLAVPPGTVNVIARWRAKVKGAKLKGAAKCVGKVYAPRVPKVKPGGTVAAAVVQLSALSNELREDEAEATLKALKAESPETFRGAVATPEAGAKALRDNAVALLAGLRYRAAQRRVVWEVLM